MLGEPEVPSQSVNETDFLPSSNQSEIGQAFEDWEIERLGDVANFVNGYAFKPSQWSKSGRPIIRIQNLTGTSNKINRFAG